MCSGCCGAVRGPGLGVRGGEDVAGGGEDALFAGHFRLDEADLENAPPQFAAS